MGVVDILLLHFELEPERPALRSVNEGSQRREGHDNIRATRCDWPGRERVVVERAVGVSGKTAVGEVDGGTVIVARIVSRRRVQPSEAPLEIQGPAVDRVDLGVRVAREGVENAGEVDSLVRGVDPGSGRVAAVGHAHCVRSIGARHGFEAGALTLSVGGASDPYSGTGQGASLGVEHRAGYEAGPGAYTGLEVDGYCGRSGLRGRRGGSEGRDFED